MPINPTRPALCTLLMAISGLAWADDEPNPYYVGVSQAVTGETNATRAADSGARGKDLISTTGLSAGLDQPLGRGRLTADLAFKANRYKNNDQFNNNSHDAKLRLDWQSLHRISGDISLYDSQRLYRNEEGGTLAPGGVSERDLLRTSGAYVGMRVGLVTLWTLEGGLAHDQARHSSARFKNNDLNQQAANLGVRLRPSDLWSVRLGVRKTEGEYPNYVYFLTGEKGDDVDREDIDLSGTWAPTGNSQLDARISSTRQTHTLLTPRDARYVTGLLGYNWALSGKTRVRLQYVHDTSVGAADEEFRPAGWTRSSDNTGVNNSLMLRATWSTTAKITTDASYTYTRRSLENSIVTGGVTSSSDARDRSHALRLGAVYQASRAVGLGCSLTHDHRTIDTDNASPVADTGERYRFSTGSCYAQIRFQ